MADYEFKWHGRKVQRASKQAIAAGLRAGAEHARRLIVQRISTSGNTGQGATTAYSGAFFVQGRRRGEKKKKVRPPRKYTHSRPGQPPRAITGKLRQSIFTSSDRAVPSSVVGTRSKVGVYLEKGTDASVIRPRRKKVMAFGWYENPSQRRGWTWRFFRRVKHPGIKPRPFIVSTIKVHKQAISWKITRAIKKRLGV